jgi:hypothetical protein
VELLRRYSDRPDVVGPLIRAWQEINNPADNHNRTVTTINGRTASPGYVRHRLSETDVAGLIEAYRSGTTAKTLAERYDVHYTTTKKKLRKHGVRRS